MKRIAVFAAALLAGIALAGPTDNSLVIGASQEPRGLDPWVNNQAISSEVLGWMFRDLTYTDASGRSQPDLAAEVPSPENGRVKIARDRAGNAVSMTVRWTLRDGLKWSDGRPITTEDLRFSYEVFGDERLPVATRDQYPKKFRVIDDRNFEVTYAPVNVFYQYQGSMGLWGNYPAPAHVWKPLWNRAKSQLSGKPADQQLEILQRQIIGADIVTSRRGPPVVSGPFRFLKWVPGQSLTMVRNPNYWQRNPTGVQRVTYRFIQNTNTLQVNVLSGAIDALSSIGLANSPQTLQTLRANARGVFDVYQVAGGAVERLDINKYGTVQNVRDLMLDDVRTRQALAYAIDRKTIASELLGGTVVPTNTWVHVDSPVYSAATADAYPYNPEKARDLLAALGWKPGGDGILERTVDGRTVKFVIEFVTVAGNAVRERNQQFIKDNLRQVGIDVKLNNAPSAVVFDDAFLQHGSEGSWKGLFEYAFIGNPIIEDGATFYCDDPSSQTVSDNVPRRENGFQGQNEGGWCNAAFDKLWDEARRELDPAKRKALLAQMQKVFAADLPVIPLYTRLEVLTIRKGLVNYTYNGPTRYPSTFAWLVGWTQRGQKVQVATDLK